MVEISSQSLCYRKKRKILGPAGRPRGLATLADNWAVLLALPGRMPETFLLIKIMRNPLGKSVYRTIFGVSQVAGIQEQIEKNGAKPIAALFQGIAEAGLEPEKGI